MKDHHRLAGREPGRRLLLRGGALLGLLLAAAWAGAEQPLPIAPDTRAIPRTGDLAEVRMVPAAAAQVEIKDYAFRPATLTVPAGTTVTWTSHDDDPHTVTSSEKVFASPGLDADETFSYTFSTPGTYTYYCTLHPHMTATIIVK